MTTMVRTIIGTTLLVCGLFCGGCSEFTVVRVGSNTKSADDQVVGQRYYLPQPFLLATPQKDGTVTFTVMSLPDKNKEYAVRAKAQLSSYSLQVVTDPLGILTGIQYNVDTTALPAQVIASGTTSAVQIANYKASQAVAVQAQVNAAQTQLLKDKAAYDADNANLQSLQQALHNEGAPGTTGYTTQASVDTQAAKVAGDQGAVAGDQAALLQIQSTAQVVAGTAAFGTPLSSTSAPVPAAPGAPASTLPGPITLADAYGPLLFAIQDSGNDVQLVPVTSKLNDTTPAQPEAFPANALVAAQPLFHTSKIAMGAPKIGQPTANFDLSLKAPAMFTLDRVPTDVSLQLYSATDDQHPLALEPVWEKDSSILVDITQLPAGGYILDAKITFAVDDLNSAISHQRVFFVVVDGKKP